MNSCGARILAIHNVQHTVFATCNCARMLLKSISSWTTFSILKPMHTTERTVVQTVLLVPASIATEEFHE